MAAENRSAQAKRTDPREAETHGGEPREQGTRQIAREAWLEFFDSFSRQHEGWLVSVEIIDNETKKVEAENLPLEGVSADVRDGEDRILVSVGQNTGDHLIHMIAQPTQVRFLQTERGEDKGLEIISADGRRNIVSFRVPSRPEMLDGKAA